MNPVSVIKNTLLMKRGERDQALVRMSLCILIALAYGISLSLKLDIRIEPLALIVFFWYTFTSSLIAFSYSFSKKSFFLRRFITFTIDMALIIFFSCMYADYAVALFVAFALPLLGYGLAWGQRYIYGGIVMSAIALGVLELMVPSFVSTASVVTVIGILVGISFFTFFLNFWSKALKDAMEEAERAKKHRSMFFANMSHELRTPLHGIMGLSELLLNSKLDSEQQTYTSQVSDAAKTMLSLVNNILDVSKLEEKKFEIQNEIFDLHSVVYSVIRLFYFQARKRSLIFNYSIDPALRFYLIGDAKRLSQVLINLIGNAVKFTSRGSVTLKVSLHDKNKVLFEVLDTGVGIEEQQLSSIFERYSQVGNHKNIRGTGLGLTISKQIVEAMNGRVGVDSQPGMGSRFWFFIPYEPGKQPTRFPIEGCLVHIIGNSITTKRVHKMALKAGAKVETIELNPAAARYGCINLFEMKGQVVVLAEDIPLHVVKETANELHICGRPHLIKLSAGDDAGASHPSVSHIIPVASPDFVFLNMLHEAYVCHSESRQVPNLAADTRKPVRKRRLRILVAEDNKINQTVISKILSIAGHEVDLVGNGQSALEKLNRYRFDLAILDSRMPVRDGLDTLRIYRKNAKSPIPVIILSADVTPETKERYLRAGANRYLGKPVEAQELLSTIQDVMDNSAHAEPTVLESMNRNNNSESPQSHKQQLSVLSTDTLESLSRMGVDKKYVEELLSRCLSDTNLKLNELKLALQNKDFQASSKLAHYIKGSLASIGAVRMGEVCAEIESNSKMQLIPSPKYTIKEIDVEYNQLRQAIKQYIDNSATNNTRQI